MTSTWVLLRGLTREAGHWGGFVRTFERGVEPGARVIALDLPGAGCWHARRSPWRVADAMSFCRDQLRSRDVQGPLRLLGLSLGGMVATAWALAHPQEVSHLVLINSSMRPLGAPNERLRARAWPHVLRAFLARDARVREAAVLRMTSRSPAKNAHALEEWLAIGAARPVSRGNALRQLIAAAQYRLPDHVPRMHAFVMCSTGDALVDPACSRRLAARWSCDIVEHPDAGHDLPLDDPDWVVTRLAAWLAATASVAETPCPPSR